MCLNYSFTISGATVFFLNELVTFIIKSRRIQNSYNIIKKKKKKGKLLSWSLSFMSYSNSVFNLLIVLIWFLTFHYCVDLVLNVIYWMEKSNMSNEIIKNYFSCHINYQLCCHISLSLTQQIFP